MVAGSSAHHSIMYIMSSCPDRTCFRRPGRSPVDSEHVATVRGVGYGSPVASFAPGPQPSMCAQLFPGVACEPVPRPRRTLG